MPRPSHYRVYEVTQEDIDNGIANDSFYCPISNAINRTSPYLHRVQTDLASIRWSDLTKRKRYVFITPDIAQQFIIQYGEGKARPFTLKLPIAAQIVEMRPKIRTPEQKLRRQELEQLKRKRKARQKKTMNREGTIIGGRIMPTLNRQRYRQYGVQVLMKGG
ncbi:MAG: hypothetical protein C5B60_02600 [Chloroflexi bacterium]|nr:MAG: hypothetical protein C5B60_02600 [Chloroflexota bacterium]